MDLSFSWTSAALVTGHKTCTRRAWSADYAERFRAGVEIRAVSWQRRFGGVELARFELPGCAYLESTAKMRPEDWEHEGFGLLTLLDARVDGVTPRELWDDWRENPVELFVVRFRPVSEAQLTDAGKRLCDETLARLEALERAGARA